MRSEGRAADFHSESLEFNGETMIVSVSRKAIEAAGHSFVHLRSCLMAAPPAFLNAPGAERVRSVFSYWAARSHKVLDYDRDADAFNRASFFKNLYKALLAVEALREHGLVDDHMPIVDLGAGAGTFSLAWKTVWPSAPTLLVDRCNRQIETARDLFQRLKIGPADFSCSDARHVTAAGYRLAEYWICSQENSELRQMPDLLGEGLIAIDYQDELERLSSLLGEVPLLQVNSRGLPLPVPDEELFGDHEINLAFSMFRRPD